MPKKMQWLNICAEVQASTVTGKDQGDCGDTGVRVPQTSRRHAMEQTLRLRSGKPASRGQASPQNATPSAGTLAGNFQVITLTPLLPASRTYVSAASTAMSPTASGTGCGRNAKKQTRDILRAPCRSRSAHTSRLWPERIIEQRPVRSHTCLPIPSRLDENARFAVFGDHRAKDHAVLPVLMRETV